MRQLMVETDIIGQPYGCKAKFELANGNFYISTMSIITLALLNFLWNRPFLMYLF